MKKVSIVILMVMLFTSLTFADRVERRGRAFFAENATINNYIYALKNAPDTNIKRYALRRLGRTNSPAVVNILIWGLRFGIAEVTSNRANNYEGKWRVRLEAARALGRFTVKRNDIILALNRSMTEDPTKVVQGEAAMAMGKLGGRANDALRKQIVRYLKKKVSQTSKNYIQLNIALVKAFGYNAHSSGRNFLLLMRVRGYSALVKRHIEKVLRRLR